MATILLAEDKENLRQVLRQALEVEQYAVLEAEDGRVGWEIFQKKSVDLVLTDLKMPEMDGITFLEKIKQADPEMAVIVMTAFGDVETAVKAMKLGAADFLTKPVDLDHLNILLKKALELNRLRRENQLLKSEVGQRRAPVTIIGNSPLMRELNDQVKRVAPVNTTILLLGESGTGKELFARVIHELSPRREQPFVPVNCAAIPDTLIENELFGYEKGAFTGAAERKLGKFELAQGGTIFLDEIGDLDLNLQAKILRVLQERQIERLGGTRLISIDVRVIAASNHDLQKAVEAQTFREDLFFRLSVFPLTLPPLRERKTDIPELTDYLIRELARELNMNEVRVADELTRQMMQYRWRGNIRELRNSLERAMLLCDGQTLRPGDIVFPDWKDETLSETPKLASRLDKPINLADIAQESARKAEIYWIRQALIQTGGNKSKAAELLGVSYKTLLNKIKDFDVEVK